MKSGTPEYQRAWRIRNPEKVRGYEKKRDPRKRKEYFRTYMRRNYERAKERIRRFKLKHPDRIKLCNYGWRKRNPEKIREYQRRYREKHTEMERLKVNTWRSKNPDKRRNNEHKRRIRTSFGLSDCSLKIRELDQVKQCHWCDSILNQDNHTIDHVTPLARGGKHSPDNLVACCKTCNSSKNSKLYWEWDGELAA